MKNQLSERLAKADAIILPKGNQAVMNQWLAEREVAVPTTTRGRLHLRSNIFQSA